MTRIPPARHTIDRDRYLRIVLWARKRYTRNGYLDYTPGRRYDRIEKAAWTRYISPVKIVSNNS